MNQLPNSWFEGMWTQSSRHDARSRCPEDCHRLREGTLHSGLNFILTLSNREFGKKVYCWSFLTNFAWPLCKSYSPSSSVSGNPGDIEAVFKHCKASCWSVDSRQIDCATFTAGWPLSSVAMWRRACYEMDTRAFPSIRRSWWNRYLLTRCLSMVPSLICLLQSWFQWDPEFPNPPSFIWKFLHSTAVLWFVHGQVFRSININPVGRVNIPMNMEIAPIYHRSSDFICFYFVSSPNFLVDTLCIIISHICAN